MNLISLSISGCYLIEPRVFQDHRGTFFESYNQELLNHKLGYPVSFVQDNHSLSHRHVLRGLHFQKTPHPQAKLIRVVQGSVLDVIVDIRPGSDTFGKHLKFHLNAANHLMLFIPHGIAHGFLSLEDHTQFLYKCDDHYHPETERGIRYDDPHLKIDWGVSEKELILSNKDRSLPFFKELQV